MAAALAPAPEIDPWHALGDATRRRVLAAVVDGPRSVTGIADGLPVSRPAVSQHLKVLLDAGLVDVEQDGRQRLYRIRPDGLEPVRRELEAFWGGTLAGLKRIAEQTYRP
ncbi:winged helix-turn-helix transcriptional regulator [Iamia sp. SCSIO 61187]|uniref:ArsR/SmtB family transcription factor n=1 Tax=Iamia sp. SCSIO 61187 TaxID=2722752 RepID=UPI001C6332FA|nr:metalloregulator ArsR/SmtB family transcription factor [Iamia sp. SCSIO 61187]QYG91552.1 winged helix-turn-helix transcriptional regulator [Iamia sp. SCSIO 61187]